MASASLVIDRRKEAKDGTFRICILLYHQKKLIYIPTGYSVIKKDWVTRKEEIRTGCKSFDDPEEINTILLNKKVSALNIIEKIKNTGEIDHLDIFELRDRILNKSDKLSFYEFSEKVIDELKTAKSYGNARAYEEAVKCLKRFLPKKENIYFDDLNFKLLKTLEAKYKAKNETVAGLNVHLRGIRAIYNRAVKEGKAKEELSPFKHYKIKKVKTHISALSKNDILKIERIELPEASTTELAKHLFLFSFYCMGMNFTDMAKLKVKNIVEGRIIYQRSKTDRPYSIRVIPKVKEILDKYSKDKKPGNYIFPIIKGSKEIIEDEIRAERNLFNRRLKRLGTLCKISKPLHPYLSRHAWANIAKEMNYPMAVISEGLGHTDIRTTQIYLDRFDNEILDDANEMITETVKPRKEIDLKYVNLL
jgi:integrase/recombinase XerD